MGDQFDELSKALASGMTRREALRRFAGGVVGVALAGVVPGIAGAHDKDKDKKKDKHKKDKDHKACEKICKKLYPKGQERDDCIARSATCPSGQCSPFVVNAGQVICVPKEHCD